MIAILGAVALALLLGCFRYWRKRSNRILGEVRNPRDDEGLSRVGNLDYQTTITSGSDAGERRMAAIPEWKRAVENDVELQERNALAQSVS